MNYTEIIIKNINDYQKIIDSNYDSYFRGHANGEDWKLIPLIGRLDLTKNIQLDMSNWTEREDIILSQFIRYSRRYIKDKIDSKLDWLTLGQHYGLPTRLLDWTDNPLIALFFALFNDYNKESAVWMIDPLLMSRFNDIDSLDDFVLFVPKIIDDRLNFQKGFFTVQPFPYGSEQFLALEDPNFTTESIHKLTKIIIPNDKDLKMNLITSLSKMGIDYGFIYPDLTGVCMNIKFKIENGLDRFLH